MSDSTERLRAILDEGIAGRHEQVWRLVSEWPDAPIEAAVALFVFGDPAGALNRLARDRSRIARRVHVDLAQRIGLEPEAQRLLDELLAEQADVDLLRRAVLPRVRARAWENARPLAERLVALDADPGHRRALAECLEGLDADAAVDAWSALARTDPEARAALVRLGAFDALRAAGETELADRTESLWLGSPGEGDAISRAAQAASEDRLEDALREARAATRSDPEASEAWTWLGELELRAGRVERGREALDRALMLAGRFHLSALLLRLKSEMEADLQRVREGARDPAADGPLQLAAEVRGALSEMWGCDRFDGVRSLDEVVRVLRESLARLGGNRTPNATFVDQGRLRRVRVRSSPREASRRALELIRVLAVEDVEAALAAVVERYPDSESPHVHWGELDLWLGRLDAARERFGRALAIQEGTRWAYIGLAGCAMLDGDLDEAMRIHRRGVRIMGSEIGSLFIYRGETHLRAGRLDEARVDLERAKSLSPTRVSAWLNLALLYARTGDEEAMRLEIESLCEHAPVWMGDAGGRRLATGDLSNAVAILERAREMACGNRSSSCQTYVASDGTLRLVQRPSARPSTRRDALIRGLQRRVAGRGAE